MNAAQSHFEVVIADLSRRIVEAEMRSTAAADALAAVARTEADTAEAERRFKNEMDALLPLRQQLCELRSPDGK